MEEVTGAARDPRKRRGSKASLTAAVPDFGEGGIHEGIVPHSDIFIAPGELFLRTLRLSTWKVPKGV